ncbi:M3 family oligoendopeptidase [Acidisphaera rubrifaciens]|uniref:Oligoendopeptidase F n=1 Tax=Acidisphaera rubrifaciens HS-AP3 TaxID=1231350 RepID=A0A0D6P757_9PROT|nr:M3 family oligoendopeptidase [Acidisphaera rubrifaciens]GAN76689.1 oligoendopeptidase F [Acidisphaera rubrifaciens HS-AP3]
MQAKDTGRNAPSLPCAPAVAAHDRSHGASAPAPTWNLSDLYTGQNDAAIDQDLLTTAEAAEAFRAQFAGRISSLDSPELASAIEAYQRIEESLGKLLSYAQLCYSAETTDAGTGQFYQRITERVTDISSKLLFFTLEINRLEDAAVQTHLANASLARWGSWIRDLRVFRPHQLSDELEAFLHEKDVTDRAWVRLFDETIASMRIPLGTEQVTVTHALNNLSDRSRPVREAAAHALEGAFSERLRLFSLITNTLAKDKHIIDVWRHYPTPGSYRNRSNMVEDDVVAALVSAVTADYPRLSHRYYALKARWLGLPKLQHWDRNAPLPEDDDREIGWDDARRCVLTAYARFSPELATIGERFFERQWIDATLRDGKSSGAFSHPTVPSVHPYILMNYHGRTRDVMTLAHELGHGVHQVLAAEQGYLLSQTPLTLAETASVFGEMLTFRSLLDNETDPRRRRIMLAGKVEDMLNTVVRQIAFYQFETLVHQERRGGELLPERINEIWMTIQRDSLGPAFDLSPAYGVFWAYIPHFIHSPFYVYAYAFGDCLVNALYDVFRSGERGFQQKYLEMLRAGGTKRHRELLAPFGLDASDPAFWRRGLDVIAGFIDELENVA